MQSKPLGFRFRHRVEQPSILDPSVVIKGWSEYYYSEDAPTLSEFFSFVESLFSAKIEVQVDSWTGLKTKTNQDIYERDFVVWSGWWWEVLWRDSGWSLQRPDAKGSKLIHIEVLTQHRAEEHVTH